MKLSEHIKKVTQLNRRFETKYLSRVVTALKSQRNAVAGVVKGQGVRAGIEALHSSVGNEKLYRTLHDLITRVAMAHARMNYTRLTAEVAKARRASVSKKAAFTVKRFGFNEVWAAFIRDYLDRNLLQKSYDIAATVRDTYLKVLNEAIEKGWGVDETVRQIMNYKSSNGKLFVDWKASQIVRTEINGASNAGAKAQSSTFPYQQSKVWIAAHDNRTRGNPFNGGKDHANHWALNGTRIDEDDSFVDPRNGDLLDHPGDPKASAASVINCRCQVAYVAKRDGRGRLIPKRKTTAVIFPSQNRRRNTITI